jgi:hypothetical protein
VRITVQGEEYNGETRYKVKWLNPAKGIAVAMEADRIKVLDAKLAEVRGAAPTPMFEAKPLAKPASESDDIPF